MIYETLHPRVNISPVIRHPGYSRVTPKLRQVAIVAPVSEPKPTRLAVAFKQQREKLGLLLQDVADRAGVSDQTVLAIINRTTPPSPRQSKNERKVEKAVEWAAGSFQAIRENREPELLFADSYERELWANPIFTDAEKRTMVADYRELKAKRSKNL